MRWPIAPTASGEGASRDRKLEIMRDSRIGAYGTCAIGLSLILRVCALAAICDRDAGVAACAILASAALSRALCLLPLALLPPARSDGSGATVQPTRGPVAIAIGLGMATLGLPVLSGADLGQAAGAIALAIIGAIGVTILARRQIGGQTGDVAGATQQAAEISVLLVLSA